MMFSRGRGFPRTQRKDSAYVECNSRKFYPLIPRILFIVEIGLLRKLCAGGMDVWRQR